MNIFGCFKLLAAGIGLSYLCGCTLVPEPRQSTIEYYDLKPPAAIQTVPMVVEQFTSFSGERQRMLHRKDETTVQGSDFHKWAQAPGALLTRYLRLAFRNRPGDPAVSRDRAAVLGGEVLSFESYRGNAVLGIRYFIKINRQTYSKTITVTEKMKDPSAASFAAAMSLAAERFAKMAAAEARRLSMERK